jgi:cobalt-zinc-cadmium resistance protein CzcA
LIKAIVGFVLTRRPIALLGLLVFIGGGLAAFSKLNIEAYPNPAPVILEITAQAPGLSAEEMERYYTVPMEVGLASTPGVDVIRSTSFYGLSFVRVVFNYGVDYYFALTQTINSLQQRVTLPNNVQPTVQGSSTLGEILRYQVVGPPHFGLTNLRTIQDWVLQRRFLSVPGVVQVVAWGGTTKEYEVEVDLHKLDAYNVTLPQVISAIANSNINVGGRTINFGQQSVNVRGVGLIKDVDDIGRIVLTQSSGVPVQVKDVAKTYIGYVPRLGRAGRDDASDVVTAIVVMNRTLHTNEVLERVKAEVDRVNSDNSLPPGVHIVPYYDRSTLIALTTHTVLHNLIFGVVLIFFIQWLFLGDLRSAIIVGANIPFALFFSVIILVLTGDSANLLSLGAVDFGIIVESAVILVENVVRNLQARPEERARIAARIAHETSGPAWSERSRLLLGSTLQVDRSILFSAIITVAAFVPLFTMQGVEGQIFGPMARTYAYALIGALLSTFTVTPVLCTYLLPKSVGEHETAVVRLIRSLYVPALRWALDRRVLVAVASVVFLAAIAFVASRLGSEFLPHLEEGNLWIRAAMPPTISLEAGMPYVDKARRILLNHPEVLTVVSQHGRPDDGSDAAGYYNAEFFAPLKPFDQWAPGLTKEKLIEQLEHEFEQALPGIGFNFSQYIQDNVEEALSGVKGSNSVKIIGPDLGQLEQLADQVLHEMSQVHGVEDLGVFRVLGQPNLNITVDRDKAARYGLNSGDLNTVIQTALGGQQATTVLEGDRQFALTVRLAPEYRTNITEVGNIKVGYQTPGGGNAYIPLSEIAAISLDTGASYIYHERNQRFIPIKFSVRGRDLGGTVAEAQERVSQNVKLPRGYRVLWSGEFEELEKAVDRLAVIVPVSLVLIMVILYGLYNSLRDSLLTLIGMPFAVAGGIVALWVSGLAFSVSAAIGFVSLFGVSVMNGILMMTYYNNIRLTGVAKVPAMFTTATQLMRPMLMTALSACIGLVPAALSTGVGSQVQRPLATVVVGGMSLGPVMLLIVVPVIAVLFLREDRN